MDGLEVERAIVKLDPPHPGSVENVGATD